MGNFIALLCDLQAFDQKMRSFTVRPVGRSIVPTTSARSSLGCKDAIEGSAGELFLATHRKRA